MSSGESAVSRRAVIAAAGIGVAAGVGAAACGRAPAGPATPAPSTPASPAPATGRPVAPAADIPVGGGTIFPDARVVVTQPTPGEFRGFGIVCTHDSCELTSVSDGTINCPCHGSRYAITDGSVVRGPAITGLRVERIAVDDGQIVVLRRAAPPVSPSGTGP